MRTQTIRTEAIRLTTRMLLVAALAFASMFVGQRVNAGSQQLIGQVPTVSSGAGLVLAVGLQRGGRSSVGLRRNFSGWQGG